MPDIKDIIGNIFISPLTDIIYEYTQCQYCSYILPKLSSALNEQDEIEAKIYSTYRVTIRVQKSPLCDKHNLYMLYEDGQEFCKEDVDASLGQITYFIAHLDELYDGNIDNINANHTDVPADNSWIKRMFLQKIGINALKHFM